MRDQPVSGTTSLQTSSEHDFAMFSLSIQELESLYSAEEPLKRLFERVERAKQEWEATADALPELVCLVNGEGSILRANQTVEAWNLGSVTAVHGLTLHEVIHPKCAGLFCYLDRFLRYARAQASLGQPAEVEAYDAALNRHLLLRARPVLTHKQVVSGTLVITVHDVTEHRRANQALKESQVRYRAVVEDLPVLICRFLPDRTLSFVNEAYCRYFGRTREELVGHSFAPLIHERDREYVTTQFNSLSREKPVVNYEHRVIAPDGEVRWMRWTDRAVFDHDRLVEFQSIGEDITERKRADEALQHYTQRLEVLSGISQAILAAHSAEAIAQAALSRIQRLVPFRHARVTLLGDKSNEFLVLAADANGEVHMQPGQSLPMEAFGKDEERRPDCFFVIPDLASLASRSLVEQQLLEAGIRSYVSLPIFAEGEFIGSFSLGADYAAAYDQEQVQVAREVADLLAIATRQTQLRNTLEQANVGLRAALQSKDQMIQNVSHELRTPLAIMYGHSEMLADGYLGALAPEQEHSARVMLEQGERLRFMVERILALQTFEAQQLQLEQIDLDQWLPETVRRWESRASRTARGAPIQFEMQCSASRILADSGLLQQVMVNLLDNAQKFSPKGGTVRIRAWEEDDQAIVAVSDEGIGIPPEKLPCLFERFYQVDGSATRRFGGMGIGLALCRAIVQAHGGRIWAESQGEGRGSTLYISLPLMNQKEKLRIN
jgi:PAS domain S-box-containing protein